ncbi:MAG TPA: hypothetical protein VJB13_04890 [Candidatus Nanoarchaeia archaeon]|nr:hypothetical protein [Candidatus Nanoarchaeia archaeon]
MAKKNLAWVIHRYDLRSDDEIADQLELRLKNYLLNQHRRSIPSASSRDVKEILDQAAKIAGVELEPGPADVSDHYKFVLDKKNPYIIQLKVLYSDSGEVTSRVWDIFRSRDGRYRAELVVKASHGTIGFLKGYFSRIDVRIAADHPVSRASFSLETPPLSPVELERDHDIMTALAKQKGLTEDLCAYTYPTVNNLPLEFLQGSFEGPVESVLAFRDYLRNGLYRKKGEDLPEENSSRREAIAVQKDLEEEVGTTLQKDSLTFKP